MDHRLGTLKNGAWRASRGRLRAAVTGPWPLCGLLLLALLVTGCRMLQKTAELPGQAVSSIRPGKKDPSAVDPVELQQNLLRFADEFSIRMMIGVEKLRRGTNALSPSETLQWKSAFGTETCAIVSGPNAVASLLDMTVFVTVVRAALEEHWQPKAFGESAGPMLESCRNAEAEIWRFAGKVLKAEQQAELHEAIETWRRQNPLPENVLAARAVGFAWRVAQPSAADPAKPGSFLNMLMLDPLSGLDPATREIAQTRLLAERVLYVTQKMPMLLRWQTELLSLNAVAQPTVQQLVTNSTQIAVSVERFVRAAEQLPGQISAERQQILQGLEAQEKSLAPLVNEVRQTLTAGSQMSGSLNTTLTTFDTLMKRFGVGETNLAGPPQTNSEPFRIQDYGRTAGQLEAAARQVTELLHTLDQTLGSSNVLQLSAKITPAVQQAQAGGKEIVDYAFWKGLCLLGIALAVALLYRWLAARLTRPPRPTEI